MQDINSRLKSIYTILNRTENIGNNISNELSNQTDTLKNINKHTNLIYDNILKNQKKLNSILTSIPKINIELPFLTISKIEMSNNNQQIADNHESANITELKNVDELDKISLKLKHLKTIANDINTEILNHNIIIDRIITNTEYSYENVHEMNRNIKKI